MKKSMLRVIAVVLVFAVLASAAVLYSSAAGTIYLDGNVYSGTLAQAITAASATGGTVGISGTVTLDKPIGYVDDTLITNCTITGINGPDSDTVTLSSFSYFGSKADIFTVKGSNVTIKNLTVDANFRVDFAIRLFNGCSNVLVDNVTALRGTRGAVNILDNNHLTLRNVRANGGFQGGFYFDDVRDAENITFENCTTANNYRCGVLIRNGYGPCMNLDLSGIRCGENTFCIEDRAEGILGGGSWADIEVVVPPLDSSGNPIRTDRALYYDLEDKYRHIRYGISYDDIAECAAVIKTTRYHMTTDIYYTTLAFAQADVREGETVISPPPTDVPTEPITLIPGSPAVIDSDKQLIFGVSQKMTGGVLGEYITLADGCNAMLNCKSAYMGTGSSISVFLAQTMELLGTYSILLYGDVNGDGLINSADQTMIKKAASDQSALTGVYKEAADVDRDGDVDTNDYTYIKKALKGKVTISQK